MIEAVHEVLPKAAHFHCSFHRRQNIAKIVRGGNVKYSCLWLFNKLVNASTKAEIEHIQCKTASYMDEKATKYLAALNDDQQYPGARCDTSRRNVFMYQCSASSAVESMNRANQSARARTAVDPVCSTTVLMAMSVERYQRKKEETWNWEQPLTPYGMKLRNGAFNDINYRHYQITIEDATTKWSCRVTRLGKAHNKERTCFFLKEFEDGSAFGGCSCGVPNTDGAPCHHMVAVVKSSRIEGLTPTNAIPYWWSTECWRKQFPFECNVTFDSSIETIRATMADTTLKYITL